MTKVQVKNEAFKFLFTFGKDIKAKFNNVCSKTGQYDVPSELFQKRTSRKNRVLISWKTVKNNKLTMEMLESFSGGVAVEFVNEDFFELETDPALFMLKKQLKNKIGSNDTVSAIITIRSESGSSSSKIQRENFQKLISNTSVNYNGNTVVINEKNYTNFAIRRNIHACGKGNHTWSGFLFVCIKGGQQDTIETHHGSEELLFNPACEFATEDVCLDLDLVVAYFAVVSIDHEQLSTSKRQIYNSVYTHLREQLSHIEYDNDTYKGNLLNYCDNHPCTKLVPGKLYDPIQVEQIFINDFNVNNKEDPRCLDFTHDEAVNVNRFYWDKKKKCILSPARPTNIFWSKHLSNMMQQNFSLEQYFQHEAEINRRRSELLNR